ncbi:fimbrial protein [Serratia fonticola]
MLRTISIPVIATLMVWGLSSSRSALAVDVLFSGTLQEPPPCEINNGNLIDVDFGNKVGISRINGVNYKQRLAYTITCAPGSPALSLGLSFNGAETSFDSAAVKTDKNGLGVRLLHDGTPFTMNTRLPINAASPPILEAVPVRDPAVTLTDGAFDATATLLADYQ